MDLIEEKNYPGFDEEYDESDAGYAILGQNNVNEIRNTTYKFYNKDTAKQTQLIIDNTGVQFKQLIPIDMQPRTKV